MGDSLLLQALQSFQNRLSNPDDYRLSNPDDYRQIHQWRVNNNENEWTQELRQVCIDLRNIGHDWQFTDEQVELLEQYYASNLLLVECMNRSYVSKPVREEIESTMLLPSKK